MDGPIPMPPIPMAVPLRVDNRPDIHAHREIIKGQIGHHILTRDDRTPEDYKTAICVAVDMLIASRITRLSVEITEDEDLFDYTVLITGRLTLARKLDLRDCVYCSQYGIKWLKDWNVEIVREQSHEAHKARLFAGDITFTPTYGSPASGVDSIIREFRTRYGHYSLAMLWIEVKYTSLDFLKRFIAMVLTRIDARYLTQNIRFFTVGDAQ